MPAFSKILSRRGTAATWTSTNPILAEGEIGLEKDTGYFKIGNGISNWTTLKYTVGPPENVHLVGAVGEPVFIGAWTNFGSGQEDVGFYKDVSGQTYLQGLIKSGSIPSIAFTLPLGYRPSKRKRFIVPSAGVYAQVDVENNGQVIIQSGVNTDLDLSPINFRAV